MMKVKKIGSAFMVIAAALVLCVTSTKAADTYYDESENRVYDRADIISAEDEQKLEEYIDECVKKGELDIIVVTVNGTGSKDSEQYAHDYYDDNEFGYECPCGSGALMLIDMGNREVAISAAGLSRVYLDDEIEYVLDEMWPYIEDAEYYKSSVKFVDTVTKLAVSAQNDDDYEEAIEAWNSLDSYSVEEMEDFYKNQGLGEKTFFTYLQNPLISGIIALVIAGITVLIMASGAKTKNTVNGRTYMETGSFKLNNRMDHYTHTTTRKVKVESNSGGGSSGGRSSSGRSHSGGSRSF